MPESSKATFKKFIDFSIGPFISAGISFFMVPLTTYFVSTDDFGKSTMFTMAYTVFSLFIFLGIDQSFVREFNVEEDKSNLFWNAFLIPFIFSIIVGILCIIFYAPLSDVMFDSREQYTIMILALSLPFSIIDKFNIQIIRMEEKAKTYSLFNIMNRLINLIVLLLFLSFVGRTYKSIINATVVSQILICILEVIVNRKYFKHHIYVNKGLIRRLLKFGLPLVPTTVIGWLLGSLDRITLRYWSNFEQIGLYSAAFKIVMLLGIIQQAFSTFWVPTAFKWHEEKVDQKRFIQVSELLMSSMCILFVLIILFKGLIITLLSPAYRNSSILIPFLSFYPLMYTVSETTTLGISFSRKTTYNIIVSVVAVIINFLGNFLLVPRYGALGASVATGISYVVFFWCRTLISRRLWFPFDLKYYLINTVLLLALSFGDIIFHNIYLDIVLSILVILYNRGLILLIVKLAKSKNLFLKKA